MSNHGNDEERQFLTETDDGLRNLMAACEDDEKQAETSRLDDEVETVAASLDILPGIEVCVSHDDVTDDEDDSKPLSCVRRSVSPVGSTTSSAKSKPIKRDETARGVTPSGKGRKRKTGEYTEEELEHFRIPLDLGWSREIVWRNDAKGTGDVYYSSPPPRKRFRSVPEVITYLKEKNITDLTSHNFTFHKSILNLPNEIERGANLKQSSTSSTPKKDIDLNASVDSVISSVGKQPSLQNFAESSFSSALDSSRPPSNASFVSSKSEDRDSLPVGSKSKSKYKSLKRVKNESESSAASSFKSDLSKTKKRTKIKSPATVVDDSDERQSESESESLPLKKISEKLDIAESTVAENDREKVRASESESKLTIVEEATSSMMMKPPVDVVVAKKQKKRSKKLKKFSIENVDKEMPPSVNSIDDSTSVKCEPAENGNAESMETSPSRHLAISTTVEDASSKGSSSPPPPCPGQTCDFIIAPYHAICAKCFLGFHIRCASERGKVFSDKHELYFVCNPCYEKAPPVEYKTIDIEKENKIDNKEAADNETPVITSVSTLPTKVKKILMKTEPTNQHQAAVNWMGDVCVYFQILKSIFRQLSVVDLLRAKRVCKTWYDVATFPEFWRFASLNKCQILDWSKANPFFRQHHVQTLDFFGVRTTVKAFGEALKEMDFITGFHFGCIVPYVLTSLKDSPKVLRQMEYLKATITEQKKPDTIVDVVVDFQLFKNMCRLKFLKMQCVRNFLFRIQNISYLSCCEQLTTLILFDVKTENEDDFSFLNSLPLLETLQIGYCIMWTFKTLEIVSRLKNLQRLRLECGNSTLPNVLMQTLVGLSRLQSLCLVKFPLNKSLMDMVSKKKLNHFAIWPDFSKTNVTTWECIVDGLANYTKTYPKTFTLGILSKSVLLDKKIEMSDIEEVERPVENGSKEIVRFATADEKREGFLKSIKIDEFVNYAKSHVPTVEYKFVRDESVTSTRS